LVEGRDSGISELLAQPAVVAKIAFLRRKLLEWYGAHGDRDLPWRRMRSDWSVLVTSVLLRKTSTRQVVKVYEKFLAKYPSPEKLAVTSVDEVKELIRVLGLENQRAKQLVELARILVDKYGGRVPCSEEELLKLPGIGEYAASEILLVVCGEARPLLDTNTARLLRRVFGLKPSNKHPYKDRVLLEIAKKLVESSAEDAVAVNYALLDFARKICRARNSLCSVCPVKSICSNYSTR